MKIGNKMRYGVVNSGWILVGCDKLRNGTSDSLGLIWEDEIVPDILDRIPHDSMRIYLAGFSGGALRAYELTTRRPERFAGVIAYGGWLGGYYTYPKLYKYGMACAQVNGVNDVGAGYWTEIDAERLRKRYCSVKLFQHPGGHTIAPSDVTGDVVAWLEREWNKKLDIDGVGIHEDSISLAKGKEYVLPVVLSPYYDLKGRISWKSIDPSIATVDEDGFMTGVSTGTTRIMSSTADGQYRDTCKVTVFARVSDVKIDLNAVMLDSIGATRDLAAIVSPSDATNKSVIWSSFDTAVAVVDENGTVTATGNGTAIVKVKTEEKGLWDTILVTVSVKVRAVSADPATMTLDTIGASEQITATVYPPGAVNDTISWNSGDTSVAIVSDNGMVTAIAPGTTSIIVTTAEGGYSAHTVVTVSRPVNTSGIIAGNEILFYPNPFDEYIRIILPGKPSYNSLQFMDVTGRVLYSESVAVDQKIVFLTEGELMNLTPGIYFIRLSGTNGVELCRLIRK